MQQVNSTAPPKGGGVLASLVSWLEKAKNWAMTKVWPWAQANPKPAVAIGAIAGIGGLLFMGGNIVMNGLIAGVLVSGGIGVLIWKLKNAEAKPLRQVYNTLVKHGFATDVGLSILAFMVSPGGVTGWIAAAVAGLLASIWLVGAKPVEIKEEAETIVVEARITDTKTVDTVEVRS